MWFILDLPLNAHRIALIRSPTYIADTTLAGAIQFFLKVDMALTDPGGKLVHTNPLHPEHRFVGFVGCTLRQVLLSERSLTPLWRVLKGWSPYPTKDPELNTLPLKQADMLEIYFRHKAQVPWNPTEGQSESNVLGKKLTENTVAGYERVYHAELDPNVPYQERVRIMASRPIGWQRYQPKPLLTPVDLIMKECVRRGINQYPWWLDMMMPPYPSKWNVYTEEYYYDLMTRDFFKGLREKIAAANKADEEREAEAAMEKQLEESLKMGEVEEGDFANEKIQPGDEEGRMMEDQIEESVNENESEHQGTDGMDEA